MGWLDLAFAGGVLAGALAILILLWRD